MTARIATPDPQEIAERARLAPVYEVASRTPLAHARRISAAVGARVLIKREDLQPVHSFKLRGAYLKLRALAVAGVREVCAASAGNHAQGVALSAASLGLEATIFMPVTTPAIKVDAVRSLGATVKLVGDHFDASQAACRTHARAAHSAMIHPFDDVEVICGQATIGTEIADQLERAPDRIYIPVGGGGLLAGVGAAIKARWPTTRVIGVECDEAPCLSAALKAGKPVAIQARGGFADGIAVQKIGRHTFEIARQVIDEVVLVSADQICAAVRDVYFDLRAILEPAGAAAMAAMRQHAGQGRGQTWIGIASGANVNFDRLGHIVERAEYGSGEEALLAAEIPERAGEFLRFCRAVGHRGVTEFNYRFDDAQVARVLVGLRADPAATREVLRSLAAAGYPARDLTGNDLARKHLRHMMGGQPALPLPERVLRFDFPERPGALHDFLTRLAGRWSISLFHYRNHGASYGQVLVGFLVADQDAARFEAFVAETGYNAQEETSNPAYQMFMGPAAAPQAVA